MFNLMVKKDKMLKLKNIVIITSAALFLVGCGTGEESDDFAPTLALDAAIVYVKRPITIPVDALDNDEVITPLANPENSFTFSPGGNLYLRESGADGTETNLTQQDTAVGQNIGTVAAPILTDIEGDVSDPDVNFDGTKVVFAMKVGELQNPGMTPQPTWNIWEYEIATGTLSRVISADLIAENGNDYDPSYLPDGRIVFTSDRQATSTGFNLEYGFSVEPSLVESNGNDEPSVNLHVMSPDGDFITQISFNQSHDLNPSVMSNGQIIFSRWEATAGKNQFDIYSVNPDGTAMNVLYGSQSHDPAQGSADVFLHPREMPDGRLISTLMPTSGTKEGGELVFIDFENFSDINSPRPNSSSTQSAGQVSATDGKVPTSTGIARYGRYTTPYPIWDGSNRVLAAFTYCFVQEPMPDDPDIDTDDDLINTNPLLPCSDDRATFDEARPAYHIALLDFDTKTQFTVVKPETGMVMMEPVAIVDRSSTRPIAIPERTVDNLGLDGTLSSGMGAIKIRSIYDTRGFSNLGLNTAEIAQLTCNGSVPCVAGNEANVDFAALANTDINSLPVRFIRIITPMPNLDIDDINQARGGAGNRMLAIAGYAPVEPDGSVYTEVPGDIPFKIEMLDANGQKIGAGQNNGITGNWLQVRPGETLVCNGCHDAKDGSPARNTGADALGSLATGIFANVNANTIMDIGDPIDGDPTNTALSNQSTIYIPELGQTMAEARISLGCANENNVACNYDSRKLMGDIVYEEVWPATAVVGLEADISLYYKDPFVGDSANGLTAPDDDGLYSKDHLAAPGDEVPNNGGYPVLNAGPVNATACIGELGTVDGGGNFVPADLSDKGDWASNCRIVINYKDHIQPMFDRTRLRADGLTDDRCTQCHNKVDLAAAMQLPYGDRQLDLTFDGSISVARVNNIANNNSDVIFTNYNDNWTLSYNEFLRPGKFEIEIVGAAFQIVQAAIITDVPTVVPDPADPTQTITIQVPTADTADTRINAPNLISTFNAAGSNLVVKMTTEAAGGAACVYDNTNPALRTTQCDHTQMMTRAEVRLLREWIDTGAHYYNNPFGFVLP